MNRKETKQLVTDVIEYLNGLGTLTSRSMFGGYGICKNKVMFGLVSDNKFYLRANRNLEQVFITHGMAQFIYSKRGIPVLLRYFHVHESLWKEKAVLDALVNYSLSAAVNDLEEKTKQDAARLKDLPNLNISVERLLRRVGIVSVDDLISLGAINSYIRIRTIKKDVSPDLLFSLAGAIEGCHSAALPEAIRDELLDHLKCSCG
ncbi:TfoX/Sxy family DNA transformation protein [Budvicia diplopodorum]|uniref:TfoX/Sxy family DNA transformation protein n=1 Tax=Budvicia diplopodorum TaxID=1119056 RepID=UPI001359F58F|nr:TfoX/Sxy family DNA transformation protein [Budvicia diplopodorum]